MTIIKKAIKMFLLVLSYAAILSIGIIIGIYYGRFDRDVELMQLLEQKGGAPVLLYKEDLERFEL